MRCKVELRAEGIQVETTDEDAARHNAQEDAVEFYGDWTWSVDAVETVGDDGKPIAEAETSCVEDMEIDVEHVDDDGHLWTFDARATVIVEAEDEDAARALAVKVPAMLRYGEDHVAEEGVSPRI